MKMTRKTLAATIIAALAALSNAHALSIAAELSVFNAPNYFGNYYTQSAVTATDTPYNLPFSSLGDTELTVSFSAPTGKKFVLDLPSNLPETAQIDTSAGFTAGSSFSGERIDLVGSVEFTNASPGLSASGTFYAYSDGDVAFGSNILFNNLDAGDNVQFSSVILTVTVPASYNVDLSGNIPATFPNLNITISDFVSGFDDPGAVLSLANVPEPSSYATLAGLGILTAAGLRRWRSKRKAA